MRANGLRKVRLVDSLASSLSQPGLNGRNRCGPLKYVKFFSFIFFRNFIKTSSKLYLTFRDNIHHFFKCSWIQEMFVHSKKFMTLKNVHTFERFMN